MLDKLIRPGENPLKINPDNLADLTPVIVESLKIYDFPMSEAQMRKILE